MDKDLQYRLFKSDFVNVLSKQSLMMIGDYRWLRILIILINGKTIRLELAFKIFNHVGRFDL